MQAGLLKELIEIYAPNLTTNEYGEQVQEYIKHYTTRAEVIYNSGNRNQTNNEVVFEYSRTFKVRFYVPLAENYQIKYRGKMYRILSIEPIQPYNHKVIQTELINE